MQYSIKINGSIEGFRALAHRNILQKDFSYPVFKAKRTTDTVASGGEVILRVPEGKKLSTLLRKIKETGACATLTEQRRISPARKSLHRPH